jgi:hypothetical protein
MYTETEKGSHIWDVRGLEGYKDGWYFSDETEQFNGPYDTQAEAEKQLGEYCVWLEQGRDVNESAV